MTDISKFGKGAIKRNPDFRDILFRDYIAGAGTVNWDEPYDIRSVIGTLPINNQNGSSSCVGQSCSKLAEIAEAFESKNQTRLSARDVYSRIYAPEGGAFGYKGLSIIVNRGVATEVRVSSYNQGNPPDEAFMRIRDDSNEATQEALVRKAKAYAHISQNIDEMAYAIKNQNGIVFGVIGTNQGWAFGKYIPEPPKSGEEVWYHFIVGIGYKKIGDKKYILIQNSWGKEWGNQGTALISEDYILGGWTFNAMTLIDLPNLPEKIFMKRVVKVDGSSDQWIVESGRRILIPDLETLAWYRDVLKIIPDASPEVIQQSEFDSLMESEAVSMGVMRAVRNAYPYFKDAMEKNQG